MSAQGFPEKFEIGAYWEFAVIETDSVPSMMNGVSGSGEGQRVGIP